MRFSRKIRKHAWRRFQSLLVLVALVISIQPGPALAVDTTASEAGVGAAAAFCSLLYGPTKIVYDPQEDPDFPEGMTISPNRTPDWTELLDAILFGIHEVELKEGVEEEEEEAAEEEGEGEGEGEEEEDEKPARPGRDSGPAGGRRGRSVGCHPGGHQSL